VENDHLEDRRGTGGIILRFEFGKLVVYGVDGSR
jgi:hypothetical protein